MRHILVAVLIGLTLVVAPSSPAEAISVTSFDKKLHKQTNKVRKAHGRKALKNGRCLDRYARRQAKRMARQQRMFHQDLGVVLRGCKARAVAENVAVGFSRPGPNVRAWLRSPGHRKNMLNRRYTRLGIGVAKGADGRFYTVQVFGRPA